MIGRVFKRGKRVYGLLWDLHSLGKSCAHSNPHLVSGWRHPAELEPSVRADGKRDFRMVTGLPEQPLAGLGDRAPDQPVWHYTVGAAAGGPELADGAWMRIAGEVMQGTGLSRYGEQGQGVRWVAVHHGENHIHIAPTRARKHGRRARLDKDRYRTGEALPGIEKEYGLQVVTRADQTATERSAGAEQEKTARAGRPELARVMSRCHMAAAAAGARSDPEFLAASRLGKTPETLRAWHDKGYLPAVVSPGGPWCTSESFVVDALASPRPGKTSAIEDIAAAWFAERGITTEAVA